jgi:D-alanyl-D-alanine dipeptidase
MPVNEPLVTLNEDFLCDSQYWHWKESNGKPLPGSSPVIAARESVRKMLKEAQGMLPHGLSFKIYDAYRPIAVQQALWDYYKEDIKKKNPDRDESEINRLTAFCVSFPSYDIRQPSLHNTGGAVDLTLVDKNGNELDMGCGFDDFSPKSWTNHYEDIEGGEVNITVRNNRRILYSVMTEVGFTNLPSEWWHYDYGDDKWAQLKHTYPIYTGILDAGIKPSEPYENAEQILFLNMEKF